MIQGPDPGSLYKLPDNRVTTIGRSSRNTVKLLTSSVSRFHCEISCVDGDWELRDLNSRRGTVVNDQRVSERHLLRPGDIIRLSSVLLRFDMIDESVADDGAIVAIMEAELDRKLREKREATGSLEDIRQRSRLEGRQTREERRSRRAELKTNALFLAAVAAVADVAVGVDALTVALIQILGAVEHAVTAAADLAGLTDDAAVAAVLLVLAQVHADPAALVLSLGAAGRGALAVHADLAGPAGVAAGPAVVGVDPGVGAGAAAVGLARRAAAAHTGAVGAGLARGAGVVAPAAVVRVVPGVHAGPAAFGQWAGAGALTGAVDAGLARGAGVAAPAAVLRVVPSVDAGAVALGQGARTGQVADPAGAGLARGADVAAGPTVGLVGAQVDAHAVAIIQALGAVVRFSPASAARAHHQRQRQGHAEKGTHHTPPGPNSERLSVSRSGLAM